MAEVVNILQGRFPLLLNVVDSGTDLDTGPATKSALDLSSKISLTCSVWFKTTPLRHRYGRSYCNTRICAMTVANSYTSRRTRHLR